MIFSAPRSKTGHVVLYGPQTCNSKCIFNRVRTRLVDKAPKVSNPILSFISTFIRLLLKQGVRAGRTKLSATLPFSVSLSTSSSWPPSHYATWSRLNDLRKNVASKACAQCEAVYFPQKRSPMLAGVSNEKPGNTIRDAQVGNSTGFSLL